MRDDADCEGCDGEGDDDTGTDGLPPMVSVAVERRDALAVTLARVERGEIVLLEERGEDVAAVVPRELAVLLAQIAGEDDGLAAEPRAGGRGGARRDDGPPPVEVSFTDLGIDADAWTG